MFDFHEKRKIKSLVFSKPAIVVLLIASCFLASGVYERYQKERETAEKHAERAAELATLEAHAAALEAEVERMQSARGIEEEIRDRFDATKQGEQTVIIMDGIPSAGVATSVETPDPEEKHANGGFFSRLLFWR